MNELDYKPNSHKYKAEQKAALEKKKVEKVVKGTVKTKKRSDIHKFTDIFISEDIKNVKSYIVMDVLVPAAKKAISDIVRDGIDMILYGDSGRGKRNTNAGYISYRDYSSRSDRDRDRFSDNRVRGSYDYDDITFQTRADAEDVLEGMDDLIENYKVVTVADLYDLIGKSCNYTDNKYGWTNLRNAEVVRGRDGWKIKLPRALPIDR